LLANCTHHELRRIDRLCTLIDVPSGLVLCTQGDTAREAFIVVEGAAVVTVAGTTLDAVGPGALIGELAMLAPDGRRTATVTTTSKATLLVFSRCEFATLMSSVPQVAHNVLQEATRRLLHNANASHA
jgi:CRP-like cAMP-binding protein